MADKIKIWKHFISPEFFPRLHFLQNTFSKALEEYQNSFTKSTYEAFRLVTMQPVLLLVSFKKDEMELCHTFLPKSKEECSQKGASNVNLTDLKQCSEENNLKLVLTGLEHSSSLHMLVVVLRINLTVPNGDTLYEMPPESKSMLLYLKKNCMEKMRDILYLIALYDTKKGATSCDCDWITILEKLTDQIAKVMNDVDKNLASRIFMRDGPGIFGKCSRILEKNLESLIKRVSDSVEDDYKKMLSSIQSSREEEYMEEIEIHFVKNVELINSSLESISKHSCKDPSKTITEIIATQMHQAVIEHSENKMSNIPYAYSSPNFYSGEGAKNIQSLVDAYLSHDWKDAPFLLKDFLNHQSYKHIANTFCSEVLHQWWLDVMDLRECAVSSLKILYTKLAEKQKNITDVIPYEVELCLGRIKEIRTLRISGQRLVIRVSKESYDNPERLRYVDTEVKRILDFWKPFCEGYTIQQSGNGFKLLKSLRAGVGIGYYDVKHKFRKGVITAIGTDPFMPNEKNFVITCAHVAPPDQKIYTEDSFVGVSKKHLCVEMHEEYLGGILDFAAVPIDQSSEFDITQTFRHPLGEQEIRPTVRIFEEDFERLSKNQRLLYLLRKSDETPIYFSYDGQVKLSFDSDSDSDSFPNASRKKGGASAMSANYTHESRFRRFDLLQPQNISETIQPGDSGSPVCFHDPDKNEIIIVFMIIGVSDDGIMCCRVYEGLSCLRERCYPIVLLHQM